MVVPDNQASVAVQGPVREDFRSPDDSAEGCPGGGEKRRYENELDP